MRLRQLYISLLIGVGTLALTACGGGDVSSASSVPPPTPTPTPTPTSAQSVTIFGSPVVGQYASVGASATGHPWTAGAGTPVGPVSTADADQVHIRYTGSGTYEVQLTGGAWNALIPYGQGTGPDVLQGLAGISQLAISGSRDKGYQYSELASWSSSSRFGAFAFGVPTAAGQVPLAGSGTYAGIVAGQSNVIGHNSFDGSYILPVVGSVALSFDFAKGSLTGAMTLSLDSYQQLPLGTFTFKDTVFSAGSTTYSGAFNTPATGGQNSFLGQFTGPAAQETIGAWALPFILSTGNSEVSADGLTHQAFGAFIAKH